ncbi:hypothetical protein HMPREF1549_02615 [Actinomyces johnsonii F0510]|uniref:Uncharacterized protein n=1 Tax=Actinomyces johnsonii F0510 TaxID=1227262 RepID=U1PI89_9ACTO|nr:hypothetical protein HMPREF1549_02615 [Actinomyces johnsonii F0510]
MAGLTTARASTLTAQGRAAGNLRGERWPGRASRSTRPDVAA